MVFRRFIQIFLTILVLSLWVQAEEKVSIVLKGSDGFKNKEIKSLVSKLESIGYENVNNNENIQDAYFEKYKEKTLDYLSFFTVTNEKVMRELLLSNPRYGAFSPFTLLAYKSQTENITWYGTLKPEPIFDMIHETDAKRMAVYTKMHADLEGLIKKEMKPTHTKQVTYNTVAKKSLLEMVKTFDRPKDLSSFIDDFQDSHDEAFENKKFIIAGYIDFKEAYADAKLNFDRYDAYWVYSLCHFKFSNSVFNRGDPQAGVFAPCSVYFYIEKGSNKLHVGMATVANWIHMSGVTEPKKIAFMKKIDKEIVAVFKTLGFVQEGESADVKVAAKVAEKKVQKVTAIIHGDKYIIGKEGKNTPTYLIGKIAPLDVLKSKLESNGFTIIAVNSVLKDKDVITVTNDTLKKLNSFGSVINILVNTDAGEIRIQNPDYYGMAYLGKSYKKGMFDDTIKALQAAFGVLYASTEVLERDDISDFNFMMGMPHFKDTIELASGKDLVAKAKKSDAVAYTLLLADGSTLVGHKLGKRTKKFLKKIAVDHNAGLLPYTVLIRDGKAVMLDPKYYLALSLPQLSMAEFMKIATIPGSIKKELAKVYK